MSRVSFPFLLENLILSLPGIATEEELKVARAIDTEYRKHLEALKDGEIFLPVLTGKKLAVRESLTPSLGKRKRGASENNKTPKRKKSVVTNDENDDEETDGGDDEDEDYKEDLIMSDDDNDDGALESDFSSLNSGSEGAEKSDSDFNSKQQIEDAMDTEEEMTEEFLKAKIEETASTIKMLRARLNSEV